MSSKVKFYLYSTFPNTFSFKAPLQKIGPYKFPSEKTKGKCGKKERKKEKKEGVLKKVYYFKFCGRDRPVLFSSTKRIVNLWSYLPVKSIFVCKDVSCDKLSDVRALAAHKFAITLLPSVPQCTLGNIS